MRNKQGRIARRHLLGVGVLVGLCVLAAAILMVSAVPKHAVAAKTIKQTKPSTVAGKAKRISDVILVKVTKGNSQSLPQDSTSTTGVSTINGVLKASGFKFKVNRLLKTNRKADLNSDFARWIKITIKNPGPATTDSQGNTDYVNVDALMTQLKQLPNVQDVENDQSVPLTSVTPDDPYFSTTGNYIATMQDMWGLYDMRLPEAWETTTGSSNIIVAVADTGMDVNHPDLTANIWTNPGEIPGNGIDDDGNGYVDDVNGWNFYDNNSQVTDVMGHGTHVGGIIGAVGNNGIGVVGINWHVKLMTLRICIATACPLSNAATAFQYATDMGAKVINNSYGGSDLGYLRPDQTFTDAVAYAHSHGVTLVAGAGNDGADMVTSEVVPAGYQDFIAVGAIADYGTGSLSGASFSNYGDRLDVVAPGVGILSTIGTVQGSPGGYTCPASFGGNYCFWSGTSMASPQVAGLAALMLSVNPNLTPEQIRQIIRSTAESLYTPGYELRYGYGLPQADAAVAAAANPTVLTPYIGQPLYLDTVTGMQTITGSVSGPNLKSWTLQVGAGEVPSAWTTIASGTSAVNSESTLANFNTYNIANNLYTYRLVATNQSNQSYYFKVYDVQINNVSDTTPPSQPTNLIGSATDHSVDLSWTASTDNIGVLNYVVRRNGVTVGNPTTNSFTDNGLQPSTAYEYTVTAVDLAGNNSTPSAAKDITTAPDATAPSVPASLRASQVTYTSLRLTWTASTDNVAVSGYRIYRSGSQIGTTTGSSYIVSDLDPGTSYSFTVKAYDARGNLSAASSALGVTTTAAKVGDVTLDGLVNIFDLSSLLSHYNSSYAEADFDHNGIVNIFDLSALLAHYGT